MTKIFYIIVKNVALILKFTGERKVTEYLCINQSDDWAQKQIVSQTAL